MSKPPLDPLAHLDDLIQQLLRNQTYLSRLLDRTEDLAEFARIFTVYGRNAVHLSRLYRDRRALASTIDPFTEVLGQALDQLSDELGLPL